MLGVRMRISQWEMTKAVTQSLSQPLLDRFYDWVCLSAIGTFVVTIFDQCDARGVRSLEMIVLADLRGEFACHWSLACSRIEIFQGGENSVGARIDADRREIAPSDRAPGIDHEQGPFGDPVLWPIGAIGMGDCSFGCKIGEQRKVQLAVFGEGAVTPGAIDRNTQQVGL